MHWWRGVFYEYVKNGNYGGDALERLMKGKGVVDPASVGPGERRAARLANSKYIAEQRVALRELISQAAANGIRPYATGAVHEKFAKVKREVIYVDLDEVIYVDLE